MQRYSLVNVFGRALRANTGWGPAWRTPTLRRSYDVVVIGGGGHGLATAYFLARKHGVRRVAGEKFQVFAINCAHLGCPVRWFPQSGLFMCPCHGGAYYRDGSRASGPPERGLFEYSYKVQDGMIRQIEAFFRGNGQPHSGWGTGPGS